MPIQRGERTQAEQTEQAEFELDPTLRKLRVSAGAHLHMHLHLHLHLHLRMHPLGDLIGAGEVPPMTVEVRMAPAGEGWLARSQETSGQWIGVPGSAWCDYNDVKLKLSVSMPLHLCVWWEREGEYAWADC
jgi:hypothetical protein